MILPVFHAPIGRTKRSCLLAGIRSYNEARVRSPFLPNLASGCTLSSKTWYSSPIAEPLVSSFKVTKYFTPLLAPVLILNSNDKSNALNSSLVTISPTLAASPPAEPKIVIVPSRTTQPPGLVGKVVILAPIQPALVLPSNSKRQPSFFSYSVK